MAHGSCATTSLNFTSCPYFPSDPTTLTVPTVLIAPYLDVSLVVVHEPKAQKVGNIKNFNELKMVRVLSKDKHGRKVRRI